MTTPTTVTAAVLVIGDEILSGRTKDRNLGYIAEYLSKIGVDVREARVVPDVEEEIVAAVNAMRPRYDSAASTKALRASGRTTAQITTPPSSSIPTGISSKQNIRRPSYSVLQK